MSLIGTIRTMETDSLVKPINPYEPPAQLEKHRPKNCEPQYSAEAFTAGAVFAVVLLVFAPGQPHPGEYTWFERILIALTWNWMTILATVVGGGAIVKGVYHAWARRT